MDFPESLAYITGGAIDGSLSLEINSDQADGTDILIFSGTEFLGQASITDKKAVVTLSRPAMEGEALSSYVEAPGNLAGPPVIVTGSETEITGWLNPSAVGEQTYAEWLESGGAEIPSVYNPTQSNANRSKELRNTIPATNKIGVRYELKAQYGALNVRQVRVSVTDVEGLNAGVLYKFDTDAVSNVNNKTYTANGNKTVRVIDASDSTNYVDIPFVVELPSEIPDPTGYNENIIAVGYNSDASNPGIVTFNVVALGIVEVSIDGVTDFGNASGPWVECAARRVWGGHTEQYKTLSGCPLGTQTLRVRLKSDTSQQVSIEIYI